MKHTTTVIFFLLIPFLLQFSYGSSSSSNNFNGKYYPRLLLNGTLLTLPLSGWFNQYSILYLDVDDIPPVGGVEMRAYPETKAPLLQPVEIGISYLIPNPDWFSSNIKYNISNTGEHKVNLKFQKNQIPSDLQIIYIYVEGPHQILLFGLKPA